jgi:hypothetical protein
VHLKTAQQAEAFAAYVVKYGHHLEDLTITTVFAEDSSDLRAALQQLLCRLNETARPQLSRLALFCDCSDADAGMIKMHVDQMLHNCHYILVNRLCWQNQCPGLAACMLTAVQTYRS